MHATPFWIAALTGAAALSGSVVTVLTSTLNDRRRLAHERRVRAEERQEATAERRRTFERENLLVAYDSLWFFLRESGEIHDVDRRTAETTEHGYGGTPLPVGVGDDLASGKQAIKTIRLILDDDIRRMALDTHAALSRVNILGTSARLYGRGPVSSAEGNAAFLDAITKGEAALLAIADRIRKLIVEQ